MAESSAGGKPADFFVGLVDFFAILLPGAMLAFVLYMGIKLAGAAVPRLASPEGWVAFAAFALIAYVLGHFLFVIGSLCLDPLYDLWKESFRVWSDGRGTMGLARLWEGLKERQNLQDQVKPFGFSSLSLAAVYLRLWNSGAAAEMDRLEADQKFFRSLILVLLSAWVAFNWDQNSPRWLFATLVLLLAGVLLGKVFKDLWRDVNESYRDVHEDIRQLVNSNKLIEKKADLFDKVLERAQKRKLKRLATLGVMGLAVLTIGWMWWFYLTPPPPRLAKELTQVERQALTVSPKGEVSLTESAPGEAPVDLIETMIRTYPRVSRTVVLLGLALSLLRFVQQRLKYSNFVYRAAKVLNTIKGPVVPGASS